MSDNKEINLPPKDTQRWVKSRKLAVVEAIYNGQITEEQACDRYDLSAEELNSWKRLSRQFGPDALKATRIKQYRIRDRQKPDFIIRDDSSRPHLP